MVCDYQYDSEKNLIRVNCLNCINGCSIEDFDVCMAKTIEKLLEIKKLVRVIFASTREYEYDIPDVKLLLEIANAYEKITRERIVSLDNIGECNRHGQSRYMFMQNLLMELKYDPIEAYIKLIREIRHTRVKAEREPSHKECYSRYIEKSLVPFKDVLEKTEMIQTAMKNLYEHKNRSLYRRMFHPTVKPNFMYTRYISMAPKNSELIERYSIGENKIEIYKKPESVRKLYHMIPPEFDLTEEEYELLDTARRYIGKHEPRELELSEPKMFRENLYRIGLDMMRDITKTKGIRIEEKKLQKLANILTRYTAGIGILELFLEDEKIQDISINSPIGHAPVYIYHGVHEQCETNIVPSREDAESWATRFRMISGRPLDEANPVLDTEISAPGGRARIAAITRTLSPDGLGFAIRRHRDKPWTYPLFIKNKMIDPFSAGLMWFLIDGSRTLLIAGTRSSGKSSFLGSCMVQIMPKLRIITTEDTLELPVEQMRNMGYNIERLKSRSVITKIETELPAEEALRTALRLGDSCLIMGEVRSVEALALYEAMRIGALANVVAGTIHGESVYGVFDRVVNDLKVPPTSFKATDIVLVCNMLKTPDGLHSFRRVVELTEVRKHWSQDPLKEGGFVNLLEYSSKEDKLKPTKTLLTGESEILNDIASRVREWRGNWDNVWNNIKLREKILSTLVNVSVKSNKPELLEASNVVVSNSMFHLYSDQIRNEIGIMDNKMIFEKWSNWLKGRL